tara:strand:- start:59 stop:430 length:372 start_codon:yes stop_codon:yes gene_type:complete
MKLTKQTLKRIITEEIKSALQEGQEDEFLETAREGITSLKEKFPKVIDMIGEAALEQAAAKQVKHQAYAGGHGGWSDRDKEWLLLHMLEKTLANPAASSGEEGAPAEEEVRSISDIWTGEDNE